MDLTTPANTCTTSPRISPASSPTHTPTGWPPAWPTSTPVTSNLAAETERLHPELPEDIVNDTVKALGYFKTNAHRMRYAYFRERGMFVGSGVVEAGCKSIVGQRLKLFGMRWNIPGATGILTCAATRPATASTTSGHSHTTRSPHTPSHDQ